tara:strand:- start:662 stop:958 length:297 start_codon:yes stop_codon:yes gene_type:complete
MGQLGFNRDELYDLTPRMFFNAQQGLFDSYEVELQTKWEIARWIGAVVINPHVKKNVQPKDLAKFPWEKKKSVKTVEEMKKIRAEAELFRKIIESKNE